MALENTTQGNQTPKLTSVWAGDIFIQIDAVNQQITLQTALPDPDGDGNMQVDTSQAQVTLSLQDLPLEGGITPLVVKFRRHGWYDPNQACAGFHAYFLCSQDLTGI